MQKIDPQKLIFLLQYIGADYGGAVEKQEVINTIEYQEMLEFSRAGVAWYQALLPEKVGTATFLKLQKLQDIITAKSDWSEVRQLTSHIIQDIAIELNVLPYPKNVLNLAEGKSLYLSACATCHGLNGDGYGASARDLKPQPNNFQNPTYMNQATPYQFFNAMTFGVTGTAMPSYLQALTEQQRWNIAFYLMTLRKGFAPKPTLQNLKISIKDLATTSNHSLIAQLTTGNHSNGKETFNELAMIDYLRLHPPQMSLKEHLQLAQQKLSKSLASYKNNESEPAIQLTLEAYLDGIEPLEPVLAYSLVSSLEYALGEYRRAIKFGEPTQVHDRYQALNKLINEIPPTIEPSKVQRGFVLIQSWTIIVREGVEATLIIAFMITYLVAAGFGYLKKYVALGAILGIVIGVLTWTVAQQYFANSSLQLAALEGMTSLFAAAVLFSVSFWIIHKVDLHKWTTFIRTKAEVALGTGSGLALASAAFLAVYREAFETVLFYQVLWLKNNSVHFSVISGFTLGIITLVILMILIFKVGLTIPLKPFFAVTGSLLGLLAFVFAGYGVKELQQIGWLKETLLPARFNWNLLEIHATIEGLTLQSGILLSFLLGWIALYFRKIRLAKQVG